VKARYIEVGSKKTYQHCLASARGPKDNPAQDREKIQQTWSEILNSPHIRFYMMEEVSILVCTCMLSIIANLSRGCAPYGLIENVVTEIRFRRQGFATELLKFALIDAWKSGCYKVMLCTGGDKKFNRGFRVISKVSNTPKTVVAGIFPHPWAEISMRF
jgi:N-acetylglutamate synthase-like GNAT family acetyltransferase